MLFPGSMDIPVIRKIFDRHNYPVILDIDCNDGVFSADRLREFEYGCYIGTDRSKAAILAANHKFGKENTEFHLLDIVSDTAVSEIERIIEAHNVFGADIVFLSMLSGHYSDPERLFSQVYKMLATSGTIMIRDVDDRDTFAFPDPDGIFDTAFQLMRSNTVAENRNGGRNIAGWLRRSGFKNVIKEACGFSAINMDYNEKCALFHRYFEIQQIKAHKRVENDPSDKQALQNLGWWTFYLPKMKEKFLQQDFEFTLGSMIFTAEK